MGIFNAGVGYVLLAPKSDQQPPTPTQIMIAPSNTSSFTPDWAATTNAGATQTAALATANVGLTPSTAMGFVASALALDFNGYHPANRLRESRRTVMLKIVE